MSVQLGPTIRNPRLFGEDTHIMRPRPLIPAILFLGALVLLGSSAPQAQAARSVQSERSLIVATKPLEPFVIKQDDRWTGFSIDLWEGSRGLTAGATNGIELHR
jgi:hypothetical protein